MNKKAVIFDMDGVLIDSEPVYLQIFKQFLEENGCRVREDIMRAIAGASAKQTWAYMAQMWKEPIEPEELHREFRRQYAAFQIPYREVMFDGVKELLKLLKDSGVVIALASSSSERAIKRMLSETGTEPYFSVVVSGELFKESKPNPEIYLYTLAQLKLPAADCLVVEDSTYGIQAAKAAGITVAAVKDDRFSYDQSGADYIIERTADLAQVLDIL
ncbi:MAG: HAD family phosphatase [Eubacteriales bacterium]|nr:HAD family phosphatase [Eubacteriales bacterium]